MIKKTAIFLPALLLLALLLLPSKKTTIFPSGKVGSCRIDTFIDSMYTTGSSRGTIDDISDTAVVFDYAVEPQDNALAVKPVSGIEFHFGNDTLDVNRYDYLDLAMVMKNAPSCNVTVVTGERLSSTASVPEPRYSDTTFTLRPNSGSYRLTLGKFDTPEWWKARIGRSRYLALPDRTPDYSKVIAIRIQITPGIPLPNPVRMEISEIEFREDRRQFVGYVSGGCITWLLVVAVMAYRRRRKEKKLATLTQPIVPVKLANSAEHQKDRLVAFIGANYQLAELTVVKVGKETGIRIDRVPALLQEKCGMNFKQYLNFVRINEAKRLLETTDENITQIAFAVGYNNIPNFNRVFKGMVGKSPTEFREKESNGSARSR